MENFKTIEIKHSDFSLEVLPYYEVLDEPVVFFGDPFGIFNWIDNKNTLELKEGDVRFTLPFFLNEAIVYNDIPIGYRYNENIIYLFLSDYRYRGLKPKIRNKIKKYIWNNNNETLPDYIPVLEEKLTEKYKHLTVSDNLIKKLKKQFGRNALIRDFKVDSNNRLYIVRDEPNTFFSEIELLERFMKLKENPHVVLDEDFFVNAYRELKKVWIDKELNLYLWYQGFLNQNFDYPLSVHDLLLKINILHPTADYDRVLPLTSYRVGSGGSYHPHVGSGGAPCTGNNLAAINRFHQSIDIQGALDVYMQYLARYTGSGAYHSIDYWLCTCGRFYYKHERRFNRCNHCGKGVCGECCSGESSSHHINCVELVRGNKVVYKDYEKDVDVKKQIVKTDISHMYKDISLDNTPTDSASSTGDYSFSGWIHENSGTGD